MGNRIIHVCLKDRRVDYIDAMNELKDLGFDVKDGVMADMVCKIDDSTSKDEALRMIECTGKFRTVRVY